MIATGGGRRVLAVVAAVAFGVAAGCLRGDGLGALWRHEASNLSAAWLVVALLPGALTRHLGRGALLGLVATAAGLLGFYTAQTVFLYGQLGGGGFAAQWRYEVDANRVYFLFGAVSGPVCGAAGAWLGRRGWAWVATAAGVVLAGELPMLALLEGRPLTPRPFYYRFAVTSWAAAVGQAVLGGLVVVGVLVRRRRSGRPGSPPPTEACG